MVAPAKRPDTHTDRVIETKRGDGNAVRARWILARIRKDPSIRHRERVQMLRDRFGCSINTAIKDLQFARQILNEQLATIDMSWVVDQLNIQVAEARADRKHNAVRALLAEVARVTGNQAPTQVDINHSGHIDVRAMAHLTVLQLTPAQRANRERELERKAALPVIDVGVAPAAEVHDALAELSAVAEDVESAEDDDGADGG